MWAERLTIESKPKTVSEQFNVLFLYHFTSSLPVSVTDGETGNKRPTMAGTSRGSTRSRASKSSAENAPILSPLNPKLRKDKTRNNSLIRIFNVNLKFLLGFGIISFVIALFFIYPIVNPMEKPQKPRVITPLPAPKLTDLPMVN